MTGEAESAQCSVLSAPRRCPDCDAVLNHPKLVMCHVCWKKLPHLLRQNFNHAISAETRCEVYRLILRHIRDKKENPELFPI